MRNDEREKINDFQGLSDGVHDYTATKEALCLVLEDLIGENRLLLSLEVRH
jgi:hypothetical protein